VEGDLEGHMAPVIASFGLRFRSMCWEPPRAAGSNCTARLDTVCHLGATVPSYLSQVSRAGTFWHEIERVLLTTDGETT